MALDGVPQIKSNNHSARRGSKKTSLSLQSGPEAYIPYANFRFLSANSRYHEILYIVIGRSDTIHRCLGLTSRIRLLWPKRAKETWGDLSVSLDTAPAVGRKYQCVRADTTGKGDSREGRQTPVHM